MDVIKTASESVPARVALALLSSLGIITVYMVRTNLSVAIVAMAHTPLSDTRSHQPFCLRQAQMAEDGSDGTNMTSLTNALKVNYNHTQEVAGKILLSSGQRGTVLSAFFYGYFLTAVVGGRLAEMFGTRLVWGISSLTVALLTFLTPVAARTHHVALIVLRFIMGLAQGVAFPSMHCMVPRWVPPLERPRFTAFVYMSSCLGIIITLPMCGLIIDAYGWDTAFYVTGCIGLAWVVLWFALMHDSPQTHPRISPQEREYIMQGIKDGISQNRPKKVQWRVMLTSGPFWAVVVGHTGSMYGWNLLVTQLPTFMDSVMGFSIKSNGFLSALPFLARFLGANSISWVGDALIAKKVLHVRTARRLFASIGLLVPGVMLACAGYVGCHSGAALTLLCLGTFANGATVSGYIANFHDIAPNFAGTVSGMSNFFAFAGATVSPIVTGVLTPDQTPSQWRSAFWVATGVYFVAAAFFYTFCSTDLQPWNFGKEDGEKKAWDGEGRGGVEMEAMDGEGRCGEEAKAFIQDGNLAVVVRGPSRTDEKE